MSIFDGIQNIIKGGEAPTRPEAQPDFIDTTLFSETARAQERVRKWAAYSIGLSLERQGISIPSATEYTPLTVEDQMAQMLKQPVVSPEVVVEAISEEIPQDTRVASLDAARHKVNQIYTGEASETIALEVRDAA